MGALNFDTRDRIALQRRTVKEGVHGVEEVKYCPASHFEYVMEGVQAVLVGARVEQKVSDEFFVTIDVSLRARVREEGESKAWSIRRVLTETSVLGCEGIHRREQLFWLDIELIFSEPRPPEWQHEGAPSWVKAKDDL